ncbi:hypothetical protein NXS19_011317 [Fusarium pseudograminearum]|nr:hypothetical protein NXS19_011317 [Fusarium pseudograminearum]
MEDTSTSDIKLVIEVKKDDTVGAMAQARTDAIWYLGRAGNNTNNPNQDNTQIFSVATAGDRWSCRRYNKTNGFWGPADNWSAEQLTTADTFGDHIEL